MLPFCWDELIVPDRGSRQRKIWRVFPSRLRGAQGLAGRGGRCRRDSAGWSGEEGWSGTSRAQLALVDPRFRLLPACLRSQNAIRLRSNRMTLSSPFSGKPLTWENDYVRQPVTREVAKQTQTYRVSRPLTAPCAHFSSACGPVRAFPTRLRLRPRISRSFRTAGACNAFASAAFRACFASVEALLTRGLSGGLRTLEPTMQTVQTDRSTFAR